MNAKFLIPLFVAATLSACSKNDSSTSTTPADYAETHEKLIQNKDHDSLKNDSAKVPSAMPPQEKPSENGH